MIATNEAGHTGNLYGVVRKRDSDSGTQSFSDGSQRMATNRQEIVGRQRTQAP